MGADRLSLFNKALADQMLGASWDLLPRIVAQHIHSLSVAVARDADWILSGLTGLRDSSESAVSERFSAAIAEGMTEADVRTGLVWDLALGQEEIVLDYWGCYAEVFHGRHPEGAISYLTLFPNEPQECFLLLMPEHVESIVHSLNAHVSELTVMSVENIKTLQTYADQCRKNPGFMAAYLYDL